MPPQPQFYEGTQDTPPRTYFATSTMAMRFARHGMCYSHTRIAEVNNHISYTELHSGMGAK